MKEQVVTAEQLTITNNCYKCQVNDEKCTDCQDDFDNRQIISAHQFVDEGNLQYSRPIAWVYDDVSGHDWISPLTYKRDGSIRQEFTDPIVHLADRIFEPDLELHPDEVICQSCHLTHLSVVHCPNCEE
jgi:hypothetical protein